MNNKETTSTRIKRLMGNMTVYELSKRTGVSATTIHRSLKTNIWENVTNLKCIAQYFNRSIDWILTGADVAELDRTNLKKIDEMSQMLSENSATITKLLDENKRLRKALNILSKVQESPYEKITGRIEKTKK